MEERGSSKSRLFEDRGFEDFCFLYVSNRGFLHELLYAAAAVCCTVNRKFQFQMCSLRGPLLSNRK